ncbi:MAG: PilZ domain-containing protein [Myxococcota bacterium]
MQSRGPRAPRRFRRCTLQIRVDYQTPDGIRSDTAITLGIGGLFIACADPQPVGTRLELRFHLPRGGAAHELEGRVVWCHAGGPEGRHAPGMGVEFTRHEPTARLARELEAVP